MQRGFNEWEQEHLITREIGLEKTTAQIAAQWANVVQVDRRISRLVYLHPANGERDVHLTAQPGEKGFQRGGKPIIGDVVEQREVQVFRESLVWYIDLLERCTALEGQTIAQRRFCDRQQRPRQYVVLFDGLIAETQPMGQARDFAGLNHVSRPNDSY